jgi:GTP-binding protein Era
MNTEPSPLSQPPVSSLPGASGAGFRSGFVALIGRPNAGKSTLINAACGRKLLITSAVAQTTRRRFRAVLDGEDYQLIFVDTPGLHKPRDLLGEELNATATHAIGDVDAIAWVLDAAAPFGRGDAWVAKLIAQSQAPRILVLNKSDLADAEMLAAQQEAACAQLDFSDIVTLRALNCQNVEAFCRAAVSHLPAGPRWFPAGMGLDQPLELIIAEFIREKVLHHTFAEVPHAVGVLVDENEFVPSRRLHRIAATIYVERESQKGIIVGKAGEQIRRIGSAARTDLEHLLNARVYLDLRVKLRKAWRRDLSAIQRFGYGETGKSR